MSLVMVQICFTVVQTQATSFAATAPAAGALCVACRQYAVVVASLGVFVNSELVGIVIAFVLHLSALDNVLSEDRGHVFGVFDGRLNAGTGVERTVLLEALSDLSLGSGEDVDVALKGDSRSAQKIPIRRQRHSLG